MKPSIVARTCRGCLIAGIAPTPYETVQAIALAEITFCMCNVIRMRIPSKVFTLLPFFVCAPAYAIAWWSLVPDVISPEEEYDWVMLEVIALCAIASAV